jgi:hypothetical protein
MPIDIPGFYKSFDIALKSGSISCPIYAGYCHTGESRYPVTLRFFNKAKVAGFRVKPGMTAKDLRDFSNRKCCLRNLFWIDVI